MNNGFSLGYAGDADVQEAAEEETDNEGGELDHILEYTVSAARFQATGLPVLFCAKYSIDVA